MEKNMYETYEFLPTCANAEDEQFFVVQNDGTLLINRQVQYVSQVQDGKEVLEDVQPLTAVYDVSSQQYFVDVDNSTGLISVSDQFVLPPETNSTDYGNNYLLQSIPSIPSSSSVVQMADTAELEDTKELKSTTDTDQTSLSTTEVSETNNFTEVTLNDEQCRLLEAKGWVLLEMSGKVYLLNALGLHDITSNKKLIQDLKNDVEIIKNDPTVSNDGMVNDNNSYEIKQNIFMDASYALESNETKSQPHTVDDGDNALSSYLIKREISAEIKHNCDVDSTANQPESVESQNTAKLPETLASSYLGTDACDQKQPLNVDDEVSNCNTPDTSTEPHKKKPTMIVRLKTRLAVEDIPNKIFLGKTVNGKCLVARVRSVKRPATNLDGCSKTDHEDPKNARQNSTESVKTIVSKKSTKEAYYKAKQVESLIQKHMVNRIELTCSAEDVKSAEIVIKQLVSVPATRTPMVERNIIFTKIVQTMKDKDTLLSESEPSLVTGRVAQFDERGDWHFVYIPHLFQNLQNFASKDESGMATGEAYALSDNVEDYLLHVHVLEVKRPNAETKTSITFSKKRIPRIRQMKPPTGKAMYACSACAKIFENERDLKNHHALGCMEIDCEKPPLIIDTEKTSRPQINRKNTQVSSRKTMTCIYCKTNVKISNYKRHLQSHLGPSCKWVSPNNEDKEASKEQRPMYKCQMCTSVYYHASTLSKHIMTHHIRSNICAY